MTIRDFLDKMDDEGGVAGLASYGDSSVVDGYPLPDWFKKQWFKLCATLADVESAVADLEAIADD